MLKVPAVVTTALDDFVRSLAISWPLLRRQRGVTMKTGTSDFSGV